LVQIALYLKKPPKITQPVPSYKQRSSTVYTRIAFACFYVEPIDGTADSCKDYGKAKWEEFMLRNWTIFLAATTALSFGFLNQASGAAFDAEEATIADVHKAMSGGRITARQLVEFYLARIEAYDKKGPSINAIIHINSKALEEADRLDSRFKASGLTGPLHGIPILVKDAIATNDMPTTGGSMSLQGFVPRNEATIITKLKAAGAIILGKTNLDEFTFGTRGISSIGGQTLNPYDLTRNAAGSSGGSAAAVASNLAMAALGTDTGSSIRFPASATSLVGVRGTVGLVSRTGIMPNSMTQDTGGPITRSVEDAAVILDVIAGYDPTDLATAWSVGNMPKSYAGSLERSGLEGARIGVLKSFFGNDDDTKEVNLAVEGSIALMKKNGAVIISIEEPFDIVKLGEMQVASHETTHYFDKYLKDEMAPHASLAAILASGKVAKEVEASIRNRLKLSMKDPEYQERLLKRIELQNQIMKLMADHAIDAIVFPFNRTVVGKIGGTQARHNGFLTAVTGFPSIIVPSGYTAPNNTAPRGVPIGIEFTGRPWSEASLLRLAYGFEQAAKTRRPPQNFGPLPSTAR
jgi:Asp-tRNA(Asn)/Glu-tRNA(Gln) amidotransferase A subunit family amidase